MAIKVVAAPRIECENPKYDFGTVIGQDQITHEFVLWNRGDSPVVISKIKNCCGVESSIVPMEILPGSNAVCRAVFTTRNRYGEQDKQILIASNDPKHPYFELKMKGTLMRPVEFSPRFVRLGDVLPDSAISEAITATNLMAQGVVLESVSTTLPGLGAEIVRGGASRLQDAVAGGSGDPTRSWTIRLKSIGPLEIGQLNGQIQLNFSSGTVSVPVIGAVKPVIQATPGQIHLSPGTAAVVDRMVMLRSGDGRVFEILSARLEHAEGTIETKKLAGSRWQLKMAIHPSNLQQDACLRIETTCPAQPSLLIPLLVQQATP